MNLSWMWELDKIEHVFSCFILELIVYYVLSFCYESLFTRLSYSTLFLLLISFLKEIYDHFFGTFFDWYDIYADIFGYAFGVVVIGTQKLRGAMKKPEQNPAELETFIGLHL